MDTMNSLIKGGLIMAAHRTINQKRRWSKEEEIR
jgi:hypothetical protein